MTDGPNWENMLNGIDFSGLTGDISPSTLENMPKEKPKESKIAGKKVFVQKIVTEIWVYTDIDGKAFGHTGVQDIVILGEMDYEEALKLIGERKNKKRKSDQS